MCMRRSKFALLRSQIVGLQWGWLDSASIRNLIWLRSVAQGRPHMFFNECTVLYDVNVIKLFLTDYQMNSMIFGPLDIGIPCHRRRVYNVLSRSDTLQPAVTLDGDALKAIVGRSLVSDGTLFLRASPQQVKEFVDRLAALRSIPKQVDGRAFDCRAVMACGDRMCLEMVLEGLENSGKSFKFVDVTQTATFCRASNTIPCLLRRTTIFATTELRILLPLEELCAQCIPLTLPAEHKFAGFAPFCNLLLDDLSDRRAVRVRMRLRGSRIPRVTPPSAKK